MPPKPPRCRHCGQPLIVKRTWRRVLLHCRACSVDYPLQAFAQRIDDDIEEQLGRIPCDRI